MKKRYNKLIQMIKVFKYTALPESVLCSSFVNCLSTKISLISDCISSKLAQSPLTFNAHITYNPYLVNFPVFYFLLSQRSVT